MTSPYSDRVHYDARHAAAYDRKIRALIPAYESLHELSSFVLGDYLPAQAHILVAGSGTGEELVRYCTRQSTWQCSGIEPSGEMNARAAQRCLDAGVADRVSLIEASVGVHEFAQTFDAVTALLVWHFLPDDGAKGQFLQALATLLRPGGVMLLADWQGERGEAGFERLLRAWQAQQLASRERTDLVELDFEHLRRNVYPIPAQRRQALFEQVGLTLESSYWASFAMVGQVLRKA